MSVSGSVLRQGAYAGPTEESVVPQNAFSLQGDVSHACLALEWRTLVHQHAKTLSAMLQRIQTAVASVNQRIDALSLQALATDAERLLTAQAQQHISLERELVQPG